MGRCKRCGKKRFLLSFAKLLDVPELRAMVSHWPWHRVEVCPSCRPAFEDEFRRRVLLLAPGVMAQEGDVAERVCLLCGNQEAGAAYIPSARWTDAAGAPLAARFNVCGDCRGQVLANNIVSAAKLRAAEDFQKLLAQLPEVSDDLVRRSEGWSPGGGDGPAGSSGLQRRVLLQAAADEALKFWSAPPAVVAGARGTPARGAMMAPEKSGAIRTHLELRWQARGGPSPMEVALGIYRLAEGFTLVRYGPRAEEQARPSR
jgi:hypothetical protein